MQTLRGLIIGPAGSGKSTLAREIVREMMSGRDRPAHLAIVDTSDEWAELATAHAVITQAANDMAPQTRWRDLIKYHRRVLFELAAPDTAHFAAAIGRAVMGLGNSLVVIDEAHHIAHSRAPLELLALWTGGRKNAVHTLAITQRLTRAQQIGLNMTLVNNSTTLFVFRVTEPREIEKIGQIMPAELAARVPDLRPPAAGQPPEYVMYDMRTGRGEVVSP